MTRRAHGFTLLEALVALLVLSVGLLGAAEMLLDSLQSHGAALRTLSAAGAVRDMAERIRANEHAGAYYDTRTAATGDCEETAGCGAAQRAAADRAAFLAAARELFPHEEIDAAVVFAPATGPAPRRYEVTLRWNGTRDAGEVALTVLAQPPVAG